MELEEAIKILKETQDSYLKDELDLAIETVLQALENSIPKKKIEEKYNFYKAIVEEIKKSNISNNNATKYDYLHVGKLDILQELLEGK